MTAVAEKANILIVDDLPGNLLIYRSILEELGENLITVSSGSEALKQVLEHDLAVVLLDVQMPIMNGFETAQLIRQRKRSAHTPIIFLTAYADEVEITQGYKTGAVDYISTPAIPEVLRAKVRVFVELFRMRQQVAHQAEDQARRTAAEEAANRFAFLSEASRALATSLDLEATLQSLVKFGVPHLADLSLVSLAEPTGKIARSIAAWTESQTSNSSASIEVDCQLASWLDEAIQRTLVSNTLRSQSTKTSPGPALANPSLPSEALAVNSIVVLPLIARGRTLGALTYARRPGRSRFDHDELALAEELASRAAIAIDNALLVRDIQEADRHKNEFLAMLAHELRNPLAPVRNAMEVLRMQGNQQKEFIWAHDLITRQVSHLVRLVDDLLDVSRITRGKIKLEMKLENAADVVAVALETVRPLIDAHKHSLTTTLPDEPLWINVDSTRLAQVLSNLLTNAAKYTPDGGHLSLDVRREGREAVFCVHDSGVGIPREMLSHIFDLFTQVDRSLARSQGGLGIGLTLVRRLVELHGGKVEAFSEGPGKGSDFIVRLPAHAQNDPAIEPHVDTTANGFAPSHAYRILVVDDNQDSADSLAMLLTLNGHKVRMANDGISALAMAQDYHPDVVLLDIGLPGLNGLEVAERLRAQPETQKTLLIAVTGYGQEEDRKRSQLSGFDHHFVKPVDINLLLKSLTDSGRCQEQNHR